MLNQISDVEARVSREGAKRMVGGGAGAQAKREQAAGLMRLAAGIRRRWRWVVWPTLGAMLAASVFALSASPHYTGVAEVAIEVPEDRSRPDNASDAAAARSEAETLANAVMAGKAIDRLGLATNPEFSADGDGGVLVKFLSHLSVRPAQGSRALEIAFVSRDPRLAALGANTVAEIYLKSQAEAKANAAAAESASLSRKVDELRARAADADARVEAFRTERGAADDPNRRTPPAQELVELNTRLAAVRSAEAAAMTKAELLRKLEREGRLDEAPDPIADEPMRRLMAQRGTIQAEIADASRTLLPLHPRMKELNAELAGLDAQIHDAAAKTLRVLENDARLSHDQAASLSEALAQQSNAAHANDADLARLHALERDAKAAHDALNSAVQEDRAAALRDSDGGASAGARMISAAVPPRTTAFSQVWRTVLLAMLAALAVSTGVAAAASLANRDREPLDTLVALSPPPATDAATPATRSGEERRPAAAPAEAPTLDGGDAAAAETSRSAETLAERLMRSANEDGRLAALIAGNGSGRALTLALETARRLAAKGSTLLVDLGATQDWLADILEPEETDAGEARGLADLLAGRATFGDIIRRDLSSGLDVILAGGDPLGDGLAEALAALTASYGCVVLHASDWRSPPARLAVDFVDALVLAAPTLLLRRLVEEARQALGDGAMILPFAVTPPQVALQRVA